METKVINEIYFQEIDENTEKKGSINNQKVLMSSTVNVDATVGSCVKTIGDILNLKNEDIIVLDKKSSELIDVRVNEVKTLKGETLFIEDKLSVRVLEF